MVKPLSFKGEKKTKKRKHHEVSYRESDDVASNSAHVAPGEDDSWSTPSDASELTGPTVIVLATVPPTSLASDLAGNVYASQLENVIEGNPRTAEPHSVQQVWVAGRIAGMTPNEVNLKGSHGAYLSCDQHGLLSAKREARGREELFLIEEITDEDGRSFFQLQTAATEDKAKPEERKYIGARSEVVAKQEGIKDEDEDDPARPKISVTIRGDAPGSLPNTHIILRMQTRFKPQTAATKEAARVKEKISRQQLETDAGRKLNDEEAKGLKRARREGVYQESILNIRAKGKHDKYA